MYYRTLVLLSLIVFISDPAKSQDRLFNISGYIDAAFGYVGKRSVEVGDTAFVVKDAQTGFFTQRFNFLPSSEFDRFKVFANIEFKNGYSTERRVGHLQLFEAWIQYTVSEDLKIRGGILTPQFGKFNVIRDASPSHLGILPPAAFDEAFEHAEFIPEFANFAVFGSPRVGSLQLEYSVFVGNGDNDDSETSLDNDNQKDFGARIGMEVTEELEIGASAWNGSHHHEDGFNARRVLYGVDVLLTSGYFELRSEYIPGYHYEETGRSFGTAFFVSLAYTLLESVTPYVMYDYLRIDERLEFSHIQNRLSAGVHYKPTWRTALKVQYARDAYARPGMIDHSYLFVGASVLF